MNSPRISFRAEQHGMVLVSSLLLLLVVTIIAVSMFHSFGTQERIASNVREKQRAIQAATSAQQYAEWWLTSGAGSVVTTCAGTVAAPAGQICQNKLADLVPNGNVGNVPWKISGVNTGVTYAPPEMIVSTTPAADTYYQTPSFYISYIGLTDGGKSSVYQIDAVGYGGRPDAVAVVESTYKVGAVSRDLGVL
jgi:type IV pilus assembly protein PilX